MSNLEAKKADSNHPLMGDLGNFVLVVDNTDSRPDLAIPLDPPKIKTVIGEIIIPPIDPSQEKPNSGYARVSACSFCRLTSCRPDKHHSYWPKTPTLRSKRGSHFNHFEGANYYDRGVNSKLRQAPFSISPEICRSWHNGLHRHQRYPIDSDIPKGLKSETVKSAVSQYQASITAMTDIGNIESKFEQGGLSHEDRLAIVGKLEHLENLLDTLPQPNEALFPTLGYWCLKSLNRKSLNQPLPFRVDLQQIMDSGQQVIERIRSNSTTFGTS